MLRDPQKDLLILQNYARTTTEWVCVQYNLRSLPVLEQIMSSSFHNVAMDSAFWPLKRLQGKNDLERLFQFSGLEFDWLPTRVEACGLDLFKEEFASVVNTANPESWAQFLEDADVMAWTGYGTMALEPEHEETENGFVSGGFL